MFTRRHARVLEIDKKVRGFAFLCWEPVYLVPWPSQGRIGKLGLMGSQS